jgi:hypothetical protein
MMHDGYSGYGGPPPGADYGNGGMGSRSGSSMSMGSRAGPPGGEKSAEEQPKKKKGWFSRK